MVQFSVMAPKSFRLNLTSKLPILFENAASTNKAITSNHPQLKKHKQYEIFSRFDKPFGLEVQAYKFWMVYVPTVFSVYCSAEYLTFKYSFSSFFLWNLPYNLLGWLGITVGCHRYWTQKSFKANLPLQIILMCMQTISMQCPIHKWCLDHRLPQKNKYMDCNSYQFISYSYNQKKTKFQMTYLDKDPVVQFQSRYYWTLLMIFQFAIPIYILRTIWGLPFLLCIAQTCIVYTGSLHFTSIVNVFANAFEKNSFDRNFRPTNEMLRSFSNIFIWVYKTAGFRGNVNLSTIFVEFFVAIGWAWDLKTVPSVMLEQRIYQIGEGTRYSNGLEKRSLRHLVLQGLGQRSRVGCL